MLLFIHIIGLCLNIVMILVICFQLLTTLDSQLLKINLHKHDISFAQLIHFALLLMLRGHQAPFVTSLRVPMGMAVSRGLCPVLCLGEEQGDKVGLKRLFVYI